MNMNRNSIRIGVLSLAALCMFATGAGFSCAAETASSTPKGEVFIIGTDAPLASVASFTVQIQSINAIQSDGTSVPLLSGPASIDFARFNGLQTLIDINAVPAGTYKSVVVTLGTATIGYLSTTAGAPPTILTMNAMLTTNTITKVFAEERTVMATEPVGIRLDFDLHKSIQVEDGQISGKVDPVFDITVVGPDAPGAYIDEFDTGVLNVDVGMQSFTVQGPHGRTWTIDVTGSTEWDGGATLATLPNNSIVQVSGWLDRATSTITADEVSLLSSTGFYAGGLATYVTSSANGATSFDLYVRGLLPSNTGLTLGQIATVDLTGSEKYFVRWSGMRLPESISELVFNPNALLPGQSIGIGGPAAGAANPLSVATKRVVLREWGYVGTVVKDSVKVGKDTFQMTVNGFAGQLIPQTVTVYLTGRTEFRFGYTGIHEIAGGDQVRVVGLLLKNPVNGETILVGKYVDALD